MKVTTKRGEEPIESNNVTIKIGNTTYRLSESVDGRLNINKTTTESMESLLVHPRYSNEIELG